VERSGHTENPAPFWAPDQINNCCGRLEDKKCQTEIKQEKMVAEQKAGDKGETAREQNLEVDHWTGVGRREYSGKEIGVGP
jgi:hypothetical protein